MDQDMTERLLAEVLRLRCEVDRLRGLLQAKGILGPEEWPAATAQPIDESGMVSMQELVGLDEDDHHDPDYPVTKSDTGSMSWSQAPLPDLGSSGAVRSHQPNPASPPDDATQTPDRDNTASANLRRALDRQGLTDVGFELTRDFEGYRILLRRGAGRWRRTAIDEAALENEDSPQLDALIRQAKQALNG